jgi:phenylacetate-CoA oxygenase PaaH subunit
MDTQWPRYEVFEQERPDQPHRNTGTIHAPDPEMALQNARDVFVRRPECCSLWVVPAAQIFAWSTETPPVDAAGPSETLEVTRAPEAYAIFQKQGQRQGETYVTHVGQVMARTPAEAMRQALAEFNTGSVFVWWVVPVRAVRQSAPGDAESWFDPARHKPYRQPNYYHVFTQMRAASPADKP